LWKIRKRTIIFLGVPVEINRVIIIVLDSLGIGELPDAGLFGDKGSNTLKSVIAGAGRDVELKNLTALGLGLIDGVTGVAPVALPGASYGRMMEASPGKDTITGHLEMAGVVLKKAFALYQEGFSEEILSRFTLATGYDYLFGKAASGTEIIERFGVEHIKTGKPILYTSADSVFQIAAHEDVIPLRELYSICARSRAFLDEYNIGRVIARPFTGEPGSFTRSGARRDFSFAVSELTILDRLTERGLPVVAIGKIGDIFAHRGMTKEVHTAGNEEAIRETIKNMGGESGGLIFVNLVDFDMLYGHRNDSKGYALALESFDAMLPEVIEALNKDDLLILTADHGCDPAFPGTDHTREYVPLLAYAPGSGHGTGLGTRESFADIAGTIAEIFALEGFDIGRSFLDELPPLS
jgi:phosphopentomutase